MKVDLKSRKFWLVACGLWLVAGGLAFSNKVTNQEENRKEVSSYMPCAQISSCIAGIKTFLIRQIITKKGSDKIDINELPEYDLSTPEIKKTIQDTMRLFKNNSDGKQFILALSNRVEGAGTNIPELLAVITGIKPELCKGVIKSNKGIRQVGVEVDIPKSGRPNLLPYPAIAEDQKVVTLPPTSSGVNCVQAGEEFYYYQVIYAF